MSDAAHFVGTCAGRASHFSSVGYDRRCGARDIVRRCANAQASAKTPACSFARTSSCCMNGLFVSSSEGIRRMELDFVAIFDIPAESRAAAVDRLERRQSRDPSLDAGLLGSRTQHEVWDANPDALIASSIASRQGARASRWRVRVTGRWPFSSGVTTPNGTCSPSRSTTATRRSTGGSAWCEIRLRDHRHLVRDGMSEPGARTSPSRSCSSRAPRARAADHRGGYEHPGAAINRSALFGIPVIGAPAFRFRRLDRRCGGRLRALHRRDGKRMAPIRRKVATSSRADQARTRPRADRFRPRAFAQCLDRVSGDVGARRDPDIATKLRFRAQSAFAVNQAREASRRCGPAMAPRAFIRATHCNAICAT